MRGARVFVFVICFLFSANVCAKRFETRCKLVRELLRAGMHNDIFLGQWVCLIEKVSNRDTKAFVVTPSGKKNYGLFQIPSRWCREGKRGGECNITCESLLDDDIRNDTACALNIFLREGFKYWTQWEIRCKNDNHISKEIYKKYFMNHTDNFIAYPMMYNTLRCPDLMSQRVSPDRNL